MHLVGVVGHTIPKDVAVCLWYNHSSAEPVGQPASMKNWMNTSDSSLVRGNKQHPWSVLLPNHPGKENHFSQKHQWSHLGLKAPWNSLHIRSAYAKELNEGLWKCYVPQTSLTNSCNSLKKLYIFMSFYLRTMNLFGGDKWFLASKEQDFIKLSLFWKKQAVTPISAVPGSQ